MQPADMPEIKNVTPSVLVSYLLLQQNTTV